MGFLIVDLNGTCLSTDEREWLQHPGVVGVILFTRNYVSLEQLRALTSEIKTLRPDLLIAVDQEGGRVQRFHNGFTNLPSMSYFGQRYQDDPAAAQEELQIQLKIVLEELKNVGIDINLIPVLDIDYGHNKVVKERSFGSDPEAIEALGRVIIDLLHGTGMPAVGKHFPGHGGADSDSHEQLPRDERDPEMILRDLQIFSKLVGKLDAIIPAHVVYPAFDPQPAGFSRYWLHQKLRQSLGFKGLIISDDLNMQGAKDTEPDDVERAKRALQAGCDWLMVCNNPDSAKKILDALSYYPTPESQIRMEKFLK